VGHLAITVGCASKIILEIHIQFEDRWLDVESHELQPHRNVPGDAVDPLIQDILASCARGAERIRRRSRS